MASRDYRGETAWEEIMRASGMRGGPDLRQQKEAPLQDVPAELGECARGRPDGCRVLHIDRRGDYPLVSLQYDFLSVRAEYRPGEFSFLFAGHEFWKLVVRGRNLRSLYDAINERKLWYLTKVDRDFGQDHGRLPVVTGLELCLIEPEAMKAGP